MIDLHCHILPGVDDGSPDLEESLAMAEMALRSGVRTIVATPHANQVGRFENYCSPQLEERFRRLRHALAEAHIPLTLLDGMEIFCLEGTVERIAEGRLMGLNGSDYYLVEFGFDADPDWMSDTLEGILALGKTPLVAHPERYFAVQDYPMLVYHWLQRGCRIQANKGSLLGRFGRGPEHTAHLLLAHDMITCVASDAHSAEIRTPHMGEVLELLTDLLDEEAASRLLSVNPRKIIRNHRIPTHGVPIVRRWY